MSQASETAIRILIAGFKSAVGTETRPLRQTKGGMRVSPAAARRWEQSEVASLSLRLDAPSERVEEQAPIAALHHCEAEACEAHGPIAEIVGFPAAHRHSGGAE